MREYQSYCIRLKKYVDFKIDNPYSEKDTQFQECPTPRHDSLPVDAFKDEDESQTSFDFIKEAMDNKQIRVN